MPPTLRYRHQKQRGCKKTVPLKTESSEGIAYMADWANTLPRKILGYRTPDELFDAALDRIYAPARIVTRHNSCSLLLQFALVYNSYL
mgnify:CR=1 FL=1